MSILTNIKFTFERRLCDCNPQKISWGFSQKIAYVDMLTTEAQITTLDFWCQTCKVKVSYPYTSLKANLSYEEDDPNPSDEDEDLDEDEEEYEDYSSNVINLDDYRKKDK